MIHTIRLQIVGAIIDLRFKNLTEMPNTNIVVKNLTEHFHTYIIPAKKGVNPDYIVDFKKSRTTPIIFKKETNSNYIEFVRYKTSNLMETNYMISVFQLELVIRDILLIFLAENEGFILHASSSIIDNKAVLFTGNSRAGKSTIASLLAKYYKQLSDDMVVIRKLRNNNYIVYQNPFNERVYMEKESKGYELREICFLKKSKNFKKVAIFNKSMIFEKLANQLFTERKESVKHIQILSAMINKFSKFYVISFDKDSNKLYELVKDN